MLSYDYEEPGEWVAAADAGRLLVVRAGDSGAAIDRLWAGFGVGDGVQGVLDELTSHGLFQTPPFALLTWTGVMAEGPVPVRTIVRGDVSVRLHTATGPIDVSGRGVATWSEQSFANVSAFDVDGGQPGASSAGPVLPLVAGMARARRVCTAASTGRSASGQVSPVAVPVPEPVVVQAPASVPVTAPVAEQTIVQRADEAEPEPEPVPAPAPRPASDDRTPAGYDHLFGVTMMRGVEQAAVRAADPDDEEEAASTKSAGAQIELPAFMTGSQAPTPPHPAAAPPDEEPGDHDGMTVMSGDIRKLRGSRERPNQATEPPVAAAPSLYLLLPGGARETLGQPVLVGRSPSVRKVSGDQIPRLVSLGGIDQDISRNHVYFALEGDTVVVTDLHSRNGTMIVLPGKPPQKLRQGEPTSVIVGTVVDLGGDITITVCEL